MRRPLLLAVALSGLFCAALRATEPTAAENAAAAYIRAGGDGFAVFSPSESVLEYNEYPPYPAEWHRLAKAAREANAPRLALARAARTNAPPAKWPGGEDLRFLNAIRALANELGDAALYEHTQGNDAEAVEFARDALTMGRSLRSGNDKYVITVLVGTGVEACIDYRLMVMAPTLSIAKTPDAANDKHVSPAVLREIISELLTPRDIQREVAAAVAAEPPSKPGDGAANKMDAGRLTVQMNRAYAEHGMLAMSLACQLYRADKSAWPASVEQLVPDYLPEVPTDPFGDGKSSLGYVLIKAGLPKGADRPLVYSHGDRVHNAGNVATEDLFYRLDEPHYGFYHGDGSALPSPKQRQGGQFRDVALWVPAQLPPGAPKTKKLP